MFLQIIVVDGPGACGKSTLCSNLASFLEENDKNEVFQIKFPLGKANVPYEDVKAEIARNTQANLWQVMIDMLNEQVKAIELAARSTGGKEQVYIVIDRAWVSTFVYQLLATHYAAYSRQEYPTLRIAEDLGQMTDNLTRVYMYNLHNRLDSIKTQSGNYIYIGRDKKICIDYFTINPSVEKLMARKIARIASDSPSKLNPDFISKLFQETQKTRDCFEWFLPFNDDGFFTSIKYHKVPCEDSHCAEYQRDFVLQNLHGPRNR